MAHFIENCRIRSGFLHFGDDIRPNRAYSARSVQVFGPTHWLRQFVWPAQRLFSNPSANHLALRCLAIDSLACRPTHLRPNISARCLSSAGYFRSEEGESTDSPSWRSLLGRSALRASLQAPPIHPLTPLIFLFEGGGYQPGRSKSPQRGSSHWLMVVRMIFIWSLPSVAMNIILTSQRPVSLRSRRTFD